MKRALDILGTVLAVVAAGTVLWRSFGGYLGSRGESVSPAAGSIPATNIRHSRGAGRVALVEFSDFSCPHCGRFVRDTYPTLEREYVEARLVTYVAFSFPLGGRIEAAGPALAAECAGLTPHYWRMRQSLFDEPRRRPSDDVVSLASRLGLDKASFEDCLQGDVAVQRLRQDYEVGRRLGVTSTPTFFAGYRSEDGAVNLVSQIRGAQELRVFRRVLDRLLRN